MTKEPTENNAQTNSQQNGNMAQDAPPTTSQKIDGDGKSFTAKDYNSVVEKAQALAEQLSSRDTELNEFKQAEIQRNEAKLLEEKNYIELIEQRDKTLAEMNIKIQESEAHHNKYVFKSQVQAAAKELQAHDISDIEMTLKMDEFKQNEAGIFSGVQERIQELKESKPYWFKSDAVSDPSQNRKPNGSDKATKDNVFNFKSNSLKDKISASLLAVKL